MFVMNKDSALDPQGSGRGNLVRVSKSALVRRINRKLVHEDEKLHACRGERWRSDLGDFYVKDFRSNFIVTKHVDPVDLAREIGVLRPWEQADGFD
jgi:hypothetical protein